MKTIKVKGVLILDKLTDSYVLHGDSEKTAIEMFKLLTNGQTPLWNFDPSGDLAHAIEIEISIPELEKSEKSEIYYSDDPEGISRSK